jgi:thiol-disulfide isomerase/thioredoxin
MNKYYSILIIFFITNLCYTQQDKDTIVNFTSAIRVNLSKFKKHQQDALDEKDIEKVNFIFDSLVSSQIIGTRFDFPSIRKLNGGRLRFKRLKKPIIIITHTDWLVKNKGELQALNKLAREYKKKVEFVFIYWNKKEGARKASKKINNNITVCYADEDYKYDFRMVKMMRNTLGFPSTYQLTEKRIITNIHRGIGKVVPIRMPLKKAKDENYLFLEEKFKPILHYADSLSGMKKKKKFLFF